jgi:hypothetical protein
MVKIGDKFIIEIDEIFENSGLPFGEKLYRAKGFKSLVFDDIGIRKLTSYAEDQGNNAISAAIEAFGQHCNEGLLPPATCTSASDMQYVATQ